VLSRQAEIPPQDSLVVMRDVDSVLAMAKVLTTDLFVIGGASVYESFLPYIDKWIVTQVPLAVERADTFIPGNYLDGFVVAGSQQLDEDLIVTSYDRGQATE
jgi:dihydrofolate reductase